MVDLINPEEQVDLDFARARRRARLGRLKTLLLKRGTRHALLSSEEVLRLARWIGGVWRSSAAGKALVASVATICAAAVLYVAYLLLFGG